MGIRPPTEYWPIKTHFSEMEPEYCADRPARCQFGFIVDRLEFVGWVGAYVSYRDGQTVRVDHVASVTYNGEHVRNLQDLGQQLRR